MTSDIKKEKGTEGQGRD